MTTPVRHLKTLTFSSILILLGAMCTMESGVSDRVCEDRTPAEAEEARELSEFSDADLADAVLDHEFALIHGHCFDEWLHTMQENPLLSHSWRSCSRGPPVRLVVRSANANGSVAAVAASVCAVAAYASLP